MNRVGVWLHCEQCARVFHVHRCTYLAAVASGSQRRFCGQACYTAAKASNPVYRQGLLSAPPWRKGKRQPGVWLTCHHCHQTFLRERRYAAVNQLRGHRHFFCSTACFKASDLRSVLNRGRRHSDETRARISAAVRAVKAQRRDRKVLHWQRLLSPLAG